MTEEYLRSLGFNKLTDGVLDQAPGTSTAAWLFQHDHDAQDGSHLYVARPFGIGLCRVSALHSPLTDADVFADVALDDQAGLASAVGRFFATHGGIGKDIAVVPGNTFRPYRRQY